jgi:alkylated DNA repair dioxygenase AlkB
MQTQLFDHLNQEAEVVNLLPKEGEVYVHQQFFSKEESDRYMDYLINQVPWQQDQMKIYGKEVKLPRLTAWIGEHEKDYSYSRISMKTNPWTPELLEIRSRVEKASGIHFTSVLLNYYRNGNDHVSWHRDNEKVLRVNPVIASVSFGATRTFRFRHVEDKKLVRSTELHHGTYVLMKGETQHRWEHEVPKTKKVLAPRISLTFRVLW